jgi:hypothetical protein
MYNGIIKGNNTAEIVRSFYILDPILFWINWWIMLYAFGLFKILMNIGGNMESSIKHHKTKLDHHCVNVRSMQNTPGISNL